MGAGRTERQKEVASERQTKRGREMRGRERLRGLGGTEG